MCFSEYSQDKDTNAQCFGCVLSVKETNIFEKLRKRNTIFHIIS